MNSLSRRKFLTNTAFLTASAATSGVFSHTSHARERKDDIPRGDRLLVKGGMIISIDPDVGDFESADILIEGSKISAVGENLRSDAPIVDASGMIVMPGFIDTHRHMWQGTLRNILPNGTLDDYIRHILGTARSVFRPEDAYIGDLVSALGAINAGITTVLDWSHIGNTPAHTDAALEGLRESGIRGVYAFGGGTAGPNNKFPDDIHRLRKEYFPSDDQLLTLALAGGINEQQWKIARDAGARISVHVNGTGLLLPVEALLGPDVTCIHCTNLLNEEWEILADKGAGVSISAPIEMIMGHGIPPIQEALDHGIRPSLSVDVETNIASGFFTQMRSIYTLQRMQAHQRARQNQDESPRLLNVQDILRLATIQGARDNGLESKTGTLKPGKEADMIMLRKDALNVLPVNNAYGAVVLMMEPANVDTVIIAGKIKKWKGELTGIDLSRIRRIVHESRNYILSTTGWRDTYFSESFE